MPDGHSCCSCEDVKKLVAELFEEKLEEIKTYTKETTIQKRKKRVPSAYNIFIGKCMKDNKTMKECASLYKKKKAEKEE